TVIIEDRVHCPHMHDVKWLIPHVPIPPYPPCVLALVHTACSQSKIMLGAFTVLANNKPAGLWPVQVNCDKPCNLPTGLQIPTRMPTVWCGFGILDILASILVAAIDTLVCFLIDKLVGGILGEGGLAALENYWMRTAAKELFAKFALKAAARIIGRA